MTVEHMELSWMVNPLQNLCSGPATNLDYMSRR